MRRRLIPLCLYEGTCQFKTQDKKTKLPICRNFNRETCSYNPCSQQFYTTAFQMSMAKGVEEFRRKRFRGTP